MVSLRSPNNPNTDRVIMQALKQIIPPQTQLAAVSVDGTGASQMYIRDKYTMVQAGRFPAGNLWSGAQDRQRASQFTYNGLTTVHFDYYDEWDDQDATIAAVRENIATDLERCIANVESNDALVLAPYPTTISLERCTISDDHGVEDRSFAGLVLIFRTASFTFNILPYDA